MARAGVANPGISLSSSIASFPYVAYTDSGLAGMISSMGSLMLTGGFLSVVQRAIAALVLEKETRTKEGICVVCVCALRAR